MKIKIPQNIHKVIAKYEKAMGLPEKDRGPSSFGWSSVSVYQTCPYLFAHRGEIDELDERFSREVGNLAHWLMELRYGFGTVLPLDVYGIKEALLELGGSPQVVEEGCRIFEGYQDHYGSEPELTPLMVEEELYATSINKTYRLDLGLRFTNHSEFEDGVYFMDHKTASAFTKKLDQKWFNDGQVLTGHHAALYGNPPVDDYRGVIINLIGKQKKEQKFKRILIEPDQEKLEMFSKEMLFWDERIAWSQETGIYPRNRSSCCGEYGLCDLFHKC